MSVERVLEPEVMDSVAEAVAYDAMDHGAVNAQFVGDFLAAYPLPSGAILDVGTGTARIPILLCQKIPDASVVAIDLSEQMLSLAEKNVAAAGLSSRIQSEKSDAKQLPFPDDAFEVVISNSIAHHIPRPQQVMAEAVRVTRSGGHLFWRDLVRPGSHRQIDDLVERYAGNEDASQQKLFADSLRAALTLEEVGDIVRDLGFDRSSVRLTSDRHWTWSAVKHENM